MLQVTLHPPLHQKTLSHLSQQDSSAQNTQKDQFEDFPFSHIFTTMQCNVMQ